MKASIYNKFELTGSGYTIMKREELYTRTESGKSWKSKPDAVKTEQIDLKHYNNYVQSIAFFNSFFGYGAYCRAYEGYTVAGYIPVKVVTVNPGQDKKFICYFSFSLNH